MFSSEEIIARKIADRCCRRELRQLPRITEIVTDCCKELQIEIPQVVYCETLTRSLSSFYLRKKPYLIFDNCLLEALYIYDRIILSEKDDHDMEKFFYKLIGEELICSGNLHRSLYFSGKYRQMDYLFERKIDNNHEIQQMISAQSYFLIGHELGHLSVAPDNSIGIPEDYHKFINVCMKVLADRVMDDYPLDKFLEMRYGYFMDVRPNTMEEYWDGVKSSKKYYHLMEECYCDFMGMKLLLEHYDNPEQSVRAISMALNYLILQEAVRSDSAEDKLFFDDVKHNASRSMYFSVLRMEILLLTLQINNLPNLEEGFREIQHMTELSKYWSCLTKKIPSEKSFSMISESDLPNIEKKELVNSLIKIFYYIDIG